MAEHPVYCPVPWCTAHAHRHGRCGDKDGPYEGIHAARILYAKGAPARVRQALRKREKAGIPNPGLSLSLAVVVQDAVDTGLIPGRPGRRKL